MLRRKWLWIGVGLLALTVYTIYGVWGVYGGFYIGYPPFTPAWMNNSNRPIVRHLDLPRRSLLRVSGSINDGRIALRVDGKVVATFLGRFDRSLALDAGKHELRLEPSGASGSVNYQIR
jgi:hypothetical protein